jgi:hypothetical protein
MPIKGLRMTTNKKNPNITNSFSIDVVPSKRVFKTPNKSYVSETEEIVKGFLALFFVLIPILLFLTWLFPKFFGVVFCTLSVWIVYKMIRKFHKDL